MELVITKPGTKIHCVDGRIEVVLEDEILGSYPKNHVSSLVCATGAHPTEPAINYISNRGGVIMFITQFGKLKSVIQPAGSIGAVQSRIGQFQFCQNEQFQVFHARKSVYAKIQNSMRFLRLKTKDTLIEFSANRAATVYAEDLETLRGIEGRTAKRYFEIFRKMVPDWMHCGTRKKRDGSDILNRSFSFMYSMLYQTAFAAITSVGLDPYLGFFHQPKYNHAALASDLIEPFRAQVADHVVLKLMTNPQFQEMAKKDGCVGRFPSEIIKMLRDGYKERLHQLRQEKDEKIDHLRIIYREASKLRDCFLRKKEEFKPWIAS